MQSSMTEWDGNTRPPYLSPRNVYAGQEARAGESDTEQRTGSKLGKKKKKLGKEYIWLYIVTLLI